MTDETIAEPITWPIYYVSSRERGGFRHPVPAKTEAEARAYADTEQADDVIVDLSVRHGPDQFEARRIATRYKGLWVEGEWVLWHSRYSDEGARERADLDARVEQHRLDKR